MPVIEAPYATLLRTSRLPCNPTLNSGVRGRRRGQMGSCRRARTAPGSDGVARAGRTAAGAGLGPCGRVTVGAEQSPTLRRRDGRR